MAHFWLSVCISGLSMQRSRHCMTLFRKDLDPYRFPLNWAFFFFFFLIQKRSNNDTSFGHPCFQTLSLTHMLSGSTKDISPKITFNLTYLPWFTSQISKSYWLLLPCAKINICPSSRQRHDCMIPLLRWPQFGTRTTTQKCREEGRVLLWAMVCQI